MLLFADVGDAPITEEAYIKASNAGTGDWFGWSVALSGDTLAVGAPFQGREGITTGQGGVYIFRRTAGGWVEEALLKASNGQPGDRFGWSVALSGHVLAVGATDEDSAGAGVNPDAQSDNSASNSGAVYLFERTGSTWTQAAYLKASNPDAGDLFGWTVAASGDAVAVGSPDEGSSGTGVGSNKQADNSLRSSGAAYVFRKTGGVWAQEVYIKATNPDIDDDFAYAVALLGDTLVVGAPDEDGGGIGVNPNAQSSNSAPDSGAVYVFQRLGQVWSQQAYLKAFNTDAFDFFGTALTLNGERLAVGAEGEDGDGAGVNSGRQSSDLRQDSGAVYLFERTRGAWAQRDYIKASNPDAGDLFGKSVALWGDSLAAGANGEDSLGVGLNSNTQANNFAPESGAAYFYRRVGGQWSQQTYVKSTYTYTNDWFGAASALSRRALAVGSPRESRAALGVNPQGPVGGYSYVSGAAYSYDLWYPRPDRIANYREGVWAADLNGNGAFDPGVDMRFAFGFPGATPVSGDWNGDGREKAGLFANGFWYLDYDGDGFWDGGLHDKQYQFGWAGVTPLVGDWNGDGRDKIGIFVDGFWFLDADGNGKWDALGQDVQAEFGWDGVQPFTGDWNGDGRDKIGIYVDGFWFLDLDGNAHWDGPATDRAAEFGWAGVTPLVSDWNGDGRASIGIYINGFWFLDADGDGVWSGPEPDIQAELGFPGVEPVTGDWNGDGRVEIGVYRDGIWYLDADGSGGWDGGLLDKAYSFGQPGDAAVEARW